MNTYSYSTANILDNLQHIIDHHISRFQATDDATEEAWLLSEIEELCIEYEHIERSEHEMLKGIIFMNKHSPDHYLEKAYKNKPVKFPTHLQGKSTQREP